MTPEHAQARCGNATASEFESILAGGKGKTRDAYLHRIVAERLTNKPAETFSGMHTRRGEDQEPRGQMAYVARTGNIVETPEPLFIKHPELAAGCSPDGLIETDGGWECKSVIPAVQVETIRNGAYPAKHKPQVQGCLWITHRQWWDFTSYCPDMLDPRLRVYIFRVERDEQYIAMLEKEVRRFIDDVESALDFLLGRDRTEELLRASLAQVAA